ncbi:MAG: VOC family protein [Gammaproteobacteria bacterium]|nr:VOC family protein [Gammaproteobacteria bacterium]
MKRLHIHIGVEDLKKTVQYYNAVFDREPSVLKHDYAKWRLDDPAVNFAVTARNSKHGLHHLGIEMDDKNDLATMADRMRKHAVEYREENNVTCCYAHSDKVWSQDPQNISWEMFYSFGAKPTPKACGNDQETANNNSSNGTACAC